MSRLLVFAYGVMSYSVFLVSYLYAVGFVGVLLMTFALPSSARAQNHSHAVASSNHLLFGCVSGPDVGAMACTT